MEWADLSLDLSNRRFSQIYFYPYLYMIFWYVLFNRFMITSIKNVYFVLLYHLRKTVYNFWFSSIALFLFFELQFEIIVGSWYRIDPMVKFWKILSKYMIEKEGWIGVSLAVERVSGRFKSNLSADEVRSFGNGRENFSLVESGFRLQGGEGGE